MTTGAFAAMVVVSPALLAQVSTALGPDVYGRLVDLHARASFEQGCDGGHAKVEQQALESRYGMRVGAVRHWFEGRFSSDALAAAVDRAFGNKDDVMVGGCLMRDGHALMPDTHAFVLTLERVEHEISRATQERR